jgi:hypothetical protein
VLQAAATPVERVLDRGQQHSVAFGDEPVVI